MKDKILRIIELKTRILKLEETDVERKNILESGSYALAEGYVTPNMEEIERLEAELDSIELE